MHSKIIPNYDTVLKGMGNALGTIWNNWQSDWAGEPITTVAEPPNRSTSGSFSANSWGATPGQRINMVPGSFNQIANWADGSIRWEER